MCTWKYFDDFIFLYTASDINEDSAHEDGPDLSVTPKSSKSEKSSSKGSKETPTRGRGRGRGRGQVGRPRKSRNDSESESPLVGPRIGVYFWNGEIYI